ncbi:MAG TPA: BlaI/MecI/CopY family transcriptional regulator [Bacteroidetes bacterium]|nr:BlaI/MecI/CopY family transcriptional regulator [Bacteroidota bacterium]
MPKATKLAPAEAEIMDGIWEMEPPVTVREVHSKLYPNGEKALTTVQTMMNILADKGFLSRKKTGMVNFYTPKLSREQAAQMEARSLVSRLFHGSFGALAAHLINSGSLSKEELRELKTLIDSKASDKEDSKKK